MHALTHASTHAVAYLCDDVKLTQTLRLGSIKQLGQETTLTACRYRQGMHETGKLAGQGIWRKRARQVN